MVEEHCFTSAAPTESILGEGTKTQPGQPRSYNDAGFNPLKVLLRGQKLRYMHRNPAKHSFPTEPEQ
jgi:hypothetical protein